MRAHSVCASALLACSLFLSLSASAAPGNGHDCKPQDPRSDRGRNPCGNPGGGGGGGGSDSPPASIKATVAVTRELLAADAEAEAAAGGRSLRADAGAAQPLPPVLPEPPASSF